MKEPNDRNISRGVLINNWIRTKSSSNKNTKKTSNNKINNNINGYFWKTFSERYQKK